MNRTILIATITALAVLPGAATAQQGSGDKAAAAKQVAPNVAEFDKQMAQAQENMKKMQEQMDKIRQTQDPQVRQKLLNEHWATMQSNMHWPRRGLDVVTLAEVEGVLVGTPLRAGQGGLSWR